jgi:hypothetical protein
MYHSRWEDNKNCSEGKKVEICGLDASGSGWETVAGSCEHSNEPSGSIKGGEFLDQVSNY